MKLSVLIIDDEQVFRLLAEEALSSEGFDVRTVGTLARARAEIEESVPDVVVLDRRLPDGDGIDFLREMRVEEAGSGFAAVVVVTAYGDVENAVEALRAGASDYLTKPLQVTDLVIKLRKVLETRDLRDRLALARIQSTGVPRVEPVSSEKRAVVERLRTVSTSPFTPVLISGPSGVGKQYAAELLHSLTYQSNPDAPFVEVNCAALTEDIAEAELFGYEKGAFPDAKFARRGLLELADGGTLFLDEITDMPLRLQSKLLKFLDNMRFRRLGSQRELTTELRVVAATNQDINVLVANGEFREDLYHRLAVFLVPIAPLVAGREDIQPLAEAFVRYFAERVKRRVNGLTEGALKALRNYDYPGNVRELRNIIERAVILSKGHLVRDEDVVLPERNTVLRRGQVFFSVELDPSSDPLPLEHVERQYVARVLMHFKGHRTAAAEALGISYPTFLKRLRELGFGEEAAG
jgi:two-component system response regulator AtoC